MNPSTNQILNKTVTILSSMPTQEFVQHSASHVYDLLNTESKLRLAIHNLDDMLPLEKSPEIISEMLGHKAKMLDKLSTLKRNR